MPNDLNLNKPQNNQLFCRHRYHINKDPWSKQNLYLIFLMFTQAITSSIKTNNRLFNELNHKLHAMSCHQSNDRDVISVEINISVFAAILLSYE